MSHSLLSILEYGVMPFLLVIATVATKYITKKSNRIKWREFLSIGLDIMLMCSFAVFIYGVSVYNHFSNNEEVTSIVLLSFISSFILFIFAVLLAILLRHWGETSNTSFWVQNVLGVLFLITFLLFVSKTNNMLSGKKTGIHNIQSDSTKSIQSDTLMQKQ